MTRNMIISFIITPFSGAIDLRATGDPENRSYLNCYGTAAHEIPAAYGNVCVVPV